MANMLRRVCHVAFLLAMSCPFGGLHAQEKPASDEVRRKAMELRLVQVDKEVGELRGKLESECKKMPPLLMVCGNDILRIQEWMETATARLKKLEGSDAHASEAKALKEEMERTTKEVLAMLEQADRREKALERATIMKRQMVALQTERERLELDLKSMWR